MIRANSHTFLPLAALAILATAGLTLAGDINPPAGPVAATMKPLTEVEPRIAVNTVNTPGDADSLFRISQPGSYYLAGNITGVAAKHGIKITTSGVTLDLMGFKLTGVPGSLDGVRAGVANGNSMRIVNGNISNWGNDGLNTATSFIRGVIVENIIAADNGSNGVDVYSAVVRNCAVYRNTLVGIRIQFASAVSDCVARENLGDGFSANTGCTFERCVASTNTEDGIQVSSACLVLNCTSEANGVGAGDGANFHVLSNRNRLEGNNSSGADRGIDIDSAGNFVVRNTCANSSVNWDIAAGNACLVVTAATNPAPFTGNAGGNAPGSTDPNANYTY